MKKLRYNFNSDGATGWAEISVNRPHPVHTWYSVTVVTNLRVLPRLALTGRSYATHSTRVVQWCHNEEAAKEEYRRQKTRLSMGGWRRVKEYAGTKA